MRNFKSPFLFFSFFLSLFIVGCSEDEVEPSFEELRNQAYDLVVVSDANAFVPVSFTAAGTDLERVIVEVTPKGSTTVIATNSLNKITAENLNRVNMTVPFPGNNVAPSGLYTVNYRMIAKNGEQSVGTYDINVINNVAPVFCTYTNNLPNGKTVWIRLYVPEGESLPANDNTIYLTGSFGTREGGKDWDGGGTGNPHTFTRLSATCYEIAMHLESGDEFKITRGNWDKQLATATGAEGSNIKYNGESTISITAFNWRDQPTVTPTVTGGEILNIPSEAVKSGMLTVVATLDNSLDATSGNYYVVEKGATSVANGYKMVAFDKKLAAAVPKKTGVEYVVVKDDASATGKNRYGFVQSTVWDGQTNPARVSVSTFGQPGFTLGNKIVIVGGATPGDWGVTSGQDFTKTAEGKYSITIPLKADSPYLILPEYNQYGDKWAFGSGTPAKGNFAPQGSGEDFRTTGLAEGTYRIDVDFTVGNGSYTLTKI
ncbi:hypothetical protein [Rufibacter latericius]|uniref:SusF/SusE family outer membrane protein n=1 Tax=Rufibacter latericius TaxID=2487040 RepID=A0A3M9MUT4_9BACT|nr:hypothetical protein [Rufibacter latericius]RNI28955.1 hypothetical protein EFB08_05845 [Rufibacter latericius]